MIDKKIQNLNSIIKQFFQNQRNKFHTNSTIIAMKKSQESIYKNDA